MATMDDGTRTTFLGEVKSAVSTRAALLVIGVLGLMAAFITSYTGAFHHPKPTDVPLAVVAPAQVSGELVRKLDQLPGSPWLRARCPPRRPRCTRSRTGRSMPR